jgi:hypothetical protein
VHASLFNHRRADFITNWIRETSTERVLLLYFTYG